MSRGPYDLDRENPFPGEPHHVQLLAKFPDEDDLGVPFLGEFDRLSRLAFESASSSGVCVGTVASPKPAAGPVGTSSPSTGSARGHNRKA